MLNKKYKLSLILFLLKTLIIYIIFKVDVKKFWLNIYFLKKLSNTLFYQKDIISLKKSKLALLLTDAFALVKKISLLLTGAMIR